MNKWLATLLGALAGFVVSFALVLLATEVVLPLMGARDAMSSGIMGTIVLVFSAPVFVLAGGLLGYRWAVRRRGVG